MTTGKVSEIAAIAEIGGIVRHMLENASLHTCTPPLLSVQRSTKPIAIACSLYNISLYAKTEGNRLLVEPAVTNQMSVCFNE